MPKMQAIKRASFLKPLILIGLPCDPGGTRIPNLLIRSQLLYPIKLRDPLLPFGAANIEFYLHLCFAVADFLSFRKFDGKPV